MVVESNRDGLTRLESKQQRISTSYDSLTAQVGFGYPVWGQLALDEKSEAETGSCGLHMLGKMDFRLFANSTDINTYPARLIPVPYL